MNHPLKNALPIVAAAYGRKFGVKVFIEGDEAFTDGDSIVLPSSDLDDSCFQQIAWGYLAHEAAHIRYTSFDVVQEVAVSPLRKALLNIVEDVRIENELAKEYPGTRKTIANVVTCLIDTQKMALPPDKSDPVTNFQAWLLAYTRFQYLGQKMLESLLVELNKRVELLFSAGFINALKALLTKVETLASTNEALELVDSIISLLSELLSAEQKQDVTTINTNILAEKNTDESEQPESGNTLQQILTASDDAFMEDMFLQIADSLSERAQLQHSITLSGLLLSEQAVPNVDLDCCLSGLNSAKIRAKLQGMVQASQENREYAQRKGSRIAIQRLAASQAGESRLFMQRCHRVAPNAAVHLLVDISNSMGRILEGLNSKLYQIANEAAFTLALALESINGVNVAVSYFPGIELDVATVLQPKQSVRKRMRYFAQEPRRGTPMAQALWFAANNLLVQKEKRKLMIVLTDGEPDNFNATVDIIDRCNRSGFELLGIGIKTSSVSCLFPQSIVINDVNDLQHELFNATKRLLIK